MSDEKEPAKAETGNDTTAEINERFYKNEDGTPDYTREVPSGLPAGVNLHEAALTRPHQVMKIVADGGPEAMAQMAEKTAVDNERALSTMIPDNLKGQDALKDNTEDIGNSTDQIQPNSDVNPLAHAENAATGEDTLDAAAKMTSDAAKAKSEQPDGEKTIKVEVVENKDSAGDHSKAVRTPNEAAVKAAENQSEKAAENAEAAEDKTAKEAETKKAAADKAAAAAKTAKKSASRPSRAKTAENKTNK